MYGNAREPCGELGPAFELVAVLVCSHVGILDDVPGPVVPDDRPRDPVEPPVVTAHDDFEERRRTRADAGNDLPVGQYTPSVPSISSSMRITASGVRSDRVAWRAKRSGNQSRLRDSVFAGGDP